MRQRTLIFTLLFLTLSIAGCVNPSTDQRSSFYENFSIGEIVTRHEQFLLPESRTLSGTEAGPAAAPFQKHEEMIVQVATGNIPALMEAVKTDVQQAILDRNAIIEGQGGSFQNPTDGPIDYISFRYSQDEISGIINLYGVRGEGTNYMIIVVLTEN